MAISSVDVGFGVRAFTIAIILAASAVVSEGNGVCGSGAAQDFPTLCYFNSDLQGRYVCCDNQGCDGFNADNLTPHCKNYGFVPPGFGVSNSNPPPALPIGDQGVCGSGAARDFPSWCYFNSDPQGRYVCCNNQGCDGFNADNLVPHCKNSGFVPPNYGVSNESPEVPRSPASDQCPSVTFDVGALATAGAACTGDTIALRPCCFAVVKLWEDLAIVDQQAANTLGVASIDLNADPACIEYTQESLRPYGVTAGLPQTCAGSLSLAFKPNTSCPTKDVPADIAQNVIDTCAGVTPDAVCGPCFDAFLGAVFYLLYPPGSPPPTSPPIFLPGEPALDCVDVTVSRLVARDPSFYRASALLDEKFGSGECTVTPPPGSEPPPAA